MLHAYNTHTHLVNWPGADGLLFDALCDPPLFVGEGRQRAFVHE